MSDLLDRYDGVEYALDDVIAALDVSATIHRVDEDGAAWCGSSGDFEYYESSVALAYGAEPCTRCYEAALEALARIDETPVERPGVECPEVDAAAVTPEPERDVRDRLPLDELPPEVLVGTGGRQVYHAPASDHTAICREEVDGTRRALSLVPGSARPCKRCFSDRVVEAYGERGAEAEAPAAATDGGRS